MKPILISSGEPSGIGPDLCLALAPLELPIVVLGDKTILAERAKALQLKIHFVDYQPQTNIHPQRDSLIVYPMTCPKPVTPGQLNPQNAPYVIDMLRLAITQCLEKEFEALVTAPIHKAVINDAGIPFSGHTEFLATQCNRPTVVMMLASETMKVALVTTHLPLRAVPDAITHETLTSVITVLNHALHNDFGFTSPRIHVAGLNPHAGEKGYLGREEIEVITPAIERLKQQGIDVQGPFPADTLFTPYQLTLCDATVAMYHDQGLPVIKHADFATAVNVTLGLPIIRTSVDHGTALELAGTGLADPSSLIAAIKMAQTMAINRKRGHAEN